MDKQAIIDAVTPEVYTIECEDARRAAPQTGRGDATQYYSSDTPYTIQDLIWYSDNGLADVEKIRLLFDVYRDMPCYALLMALGYDHLSPAAADVFWHEVRQILCQDDEALAGPLSYMLWCDFFEAPDLCEVAWQRLLNGQEKTLLVRRLLAWSGPVPYTWKDQIYRQKVNDRGWHSSIYESIHGSYYAVYGDIDKEKARVILDQLALPETREMQTLRTALAQGERYANYYRDRSQAPNAKRRKQNNA